MKLEAQHDLDDGAGGITRITHEKAIDMKDVTHHSLDPLVAEFRRCQPLPYPHADIVSETSIIDHFENRVTMIVAKR